MSFLPRLLFIVGPSSSSNLQGISSPSPDNHVEVGVNSFPLDLDHRVPEEGNSAESPPSLRYPIAQKTTSIIFTWSTIILINTIVPIFLFYVLRHIAHSSTEVVLNVCQIPMTATLFQVPFRMWQLKRRGGERSPRNRGMFTWDFFQWQFLFGALLITTIYLLATIVESYKIFAAAPPILFAELCLQFLIFDVMVSLRFRQPCRLSSVPKGALFRPCVYYMIEDLTAVDGAGCTEYRERLAERWSASPPFRRLVRDIGRILGSSGVLMAGIEITLILTTHEDIFFGVSWLILWTWAVLSLCLCVSYTKSRLQDEKAWWNAASLQTSTAMRTESS